MTLKHDWQTIRKLVLERDGHRCTKCGNTEHLDIHHIISFKVAHNHDISNLVTLCKRCHPKSEMRQEKAKGTNPYDMVTSVTVSSHRSGSLQTPIPKGVKGVLGLIAGDILDWKLILTTEEMYVKVKKK